MTGLFLNLHYKCLPGVFKPQLLGLACEKHVLGPVTVSRQETTCLWESHAEFAIDLYN